MGFALYIFLIVVRSQLPVAATVLSEGFSVLPWHLAKACWEPVGADLSMPESEPSGLTSACPRMEAGSSLLLCRAVVSKWHTHLKGRRKTMKVAIRLLIFKLSLN